MTKLAQPLTEADTMQLQTNLNSNKKKLSSFQLMILLFTLTSAGPFGIESAIQSAGVFYTLIGLMIVPFIYSIPQSLMCSELGSMMPSYHGYIIWVYRAFNHIPYIGNFIGFYNALSELLSLGSDIPLYTLLMSFYFEKLFATYLMHFELTFWTRYSFKLCVIVVGAVVNILDITILGNTTILFTIIILLPFLIGFIYSIPHINVSTWSNHTTYNDNDNNHNIQWGLFLSTLIWLHTGWDCVASLTAELNFNKSKIFASFAGGIVLDYLVYTLPVLGALTVTCSTDCWADGYLYTAYNQIMPHLGICIVISGFVSNFGCYITEQAIQARSFWALSQPYVWLTDEGQMFIEGHDKKYYDDDMNVILNFDNNKMKKIRIGMFPEWLCGTIWHKTGAPVRGVLLQSLISAALVLFDFETLLQGSTLINCVTYILEFASFIILRYTEPNTHRPFKVPGGWAVAWFITLDKMIVIVVLMYFIVRDSPRYWLVLGGSIGIALIWYLIYCCVSRKSNKVRDDQYDKLREESVVNVL
eukprot:648631_1